MGAIETDQASQPRLIGGRYRIVRALGHGGMASVYEAVDEATGRRVALKQLHPHRAAGDGQMARLFEMEFHTLAQLAHPRVVAVYNYQKLADGAFYTMELLDGGDLREQQLLPWKVVCALLCDVCSALSLLHSRRFVHRDVTPRNIRRTRDGKAKLIDFGAMVAFGTHQHAVGTPSFTAPEVVMGQPLDGRADLYSLGATAYYALTGSHAYPARTFNSLRNAWRSQPALASRRVPDIPPDLDQLVMSLLNLSPSRRPASAGAVIERLTAIAGLQLDEQLQVKRSFLSTPSLVGRDDVLQQVRRRMIGAARGRGTSIFFVGPQGVGRSRMVDACALEGKLATATVLRVDANEAQEGDWGGVRSLLEQLVTELPAAKAAELLTDHAAAIAHVWPRATELTGRLPQPFSQPQEVRAAAQDSLLNLMEDVSRQSFLVVTADDIDRVDEPTRAFVALLAQRIRGYRIVVVAAAANESIGLPGLQLLRGAETTIELEPLSPEDTERLLISVFGDVPNVRLLASRLHDLSSGHPALTMQLTQHLLDQEAIGFRDNGWLLPSTVGGDELPTSISAIMRARIARIDEESLGLARAIALSQRPSVTVEECGLLLGRPDWTAVLRHIDALVVGHVLRVVGDRYALSQPGWAPLLLSDLNRERKRALHARVAEIFVTVPGAEYIAAGHLLASDDPSRAIELLLVFFERVHAELFVEPSRLQTLYRSLPSDWKDTLDAAIAAADWLVRPRRERWALRRLSIDCLAVSAQLDTALVKGVVDQLVVDSGLYDYESLGDTVPPEGRLELALAQAQERYDTTPESERVMPPVDAILGLASVQGLIITMAAESADVAFLRGVPSLAPFAILSPTIPMIERSVFCTGCLIAGQWAQAHEGFLEVLALIRAEPESTGLAPYVYHYMELSIVYAIALTEIMVGLPAAAERIDLLEQDSLFDVNAWRLRMLQALQRGDTDTADRCERRAELLSIRNPQVQFYEGTDVLWECVAYVEIGDVARLRQTLERLDAMAAKHRYWVGTPVIARGHILRLRGEAAAAVELFENALSRPETAEGTSGIFLARGYLMALSECGRVHQARSRGAAILYNTITTGRITLAAQLHHAMAAVQLAGGDYHAALEHLRSVAKVRERWPLAEVFVGACHELRAQIAIAMRDQEAFQVAADLCAKSFLPSRNPILIARHQRLLQDAERARFRLRFPIAQSSAIYSGDVVTFISEATTMTMDSRLPSMEGSSFEERVSRALSLATQDGLVRNAMLYLLRDNVPTLVGQRGNCPDTKLIDQLVTSYLRGEIEDSRRGVINTDDFVTTTVDDSAWVGPTGTRFAPALLSHRADDALAIAGVLVFDLEGQRRPEDSLLSRISAAFTVANDVVPLNVKA